MPCALPDSETGPSAIGTRRNFLTSLQVEVTPATVRSVRWLARGRVVEMREPTWVGQRVRNGNQGQGRIGKLTIMFSVGDSVVFAVGQALGNSQVRRSILQGWCPC